MDGMTSHLCACGCGDSPTKATSAFLVGHDAKHKSNLIKLVISQLDEGGAAYAELERRNWLQFLEKSRNSRNKKVEQRAQSEKDGLPMSAIRITPDMDEDTVAGLILHRKIRIERKVGPVSLQEDLLVGKIRLVAEGEIDFYERDYLDEDKGKTIKRPVNHTLRTVRVGDIVGVFE